MINKLFLLLVLFFGLSCNQENKNLNKKNNNNMENKTFYFIDYDYNKKCGFEIYVNDILVKRYLKPVNIDNSITPINPYIIKPGKQEIKILLYPFQGNNEIPPDAHIDVKVFIMANYNNEILTSPSQGKIIFDLSNVLADKKEIVKWEYKGKFELASLPYHVEGWSNSKNLRDINEIGFKVREKFSVLQNSLNTRNEAKFITLLEKSMNESKKFYYLTDAQNETSIAGIRDLLSQPNIKCAPLDNTIVKFYANGHLATLETQDGNPALRVIEEHNGQKTENSFPLLLFMPKNSNELEVIR